MGSAAAVKTIDATEASAMSAEQKAAAAKYGAAVFEEVHQLVQETREILTFANERNLELPAVLDLTGDDAEEDSRMQFQDQLAWDAEEHPPDAGQVMTLRK